MDLLTGPSRTCPGVKVYFRVSPPCTKVSKSSGPLIAALVSGGAFSEPGEGTGVVPFRLANLCTTGCSCMLDVSKLVFARRERLVSLSVRERLAFAEGAADVSNRDAGKAMPLASCAGCMVDVFSSAESDSCLAVVGSEEVSCGFMVDPSTAVSTGR